MAAVRLGLPQDATARDVLTKSDAHKLLLACTEDAPIRAIEVVCRRKDDYAGVHKTSHKG